MSFKQRIGRALLIFCAGLGISTAGVAPAKAFVISFGASDFGLNPTFNNVQNFNFSIDIAGPLTAGATYTNPILNGIDYQVSGTLPTTTPSGFPAFSLVRSITGSEFYDQGSSLSFAVSALADLSDGLQVSELAGVNPVFLFDGHEDNTGRYHPPLFQLNADGTGSIRNSDNTGGINPGNGMVVNVDFGDEYITEITFDPRLLTLATAPAIPEPGALALLSIGLLGLGIARRRKAV